MSVILKSSKQWRNLLVQSRVLQRITNNFDGVCDGLGSSNLRGFLGTQWRGFGIKSRPPFQRIIVPDLSQHSRFSTEAKKNSGQSGVHKKNTVKPASIREDNISETSGTTIMDTSYQVYVANVPWSVKNEDLAKLFSQYGKVLDVRIRFMKVKDRKGTNCRKVGFVHYLSKSEAEAAVAALHHKEFQKRVLVVQEANAMKKDFA